MRPVDALRAAGLPEDAFARQDRRIDAAGWHRFWSAVTRIVGDPLMPLAFVDNMSAEAFSPPLFAALCSPDLATATARIHTYKPLVAPIRMHRTLDASGLSIGVSWRPGIATPPPAEMIALETCFFVGLARLATRHRVVPTRVQSPTDLVLDERYAKWLGTAAEHGP